MSIQLKYQGKQISKEKNLASYKETYTGTESECLSYVAGLTIGTYTASKGWLTSWTITQDDGPIFSVQITYTEESQGWNNTSSTITGKKSATLSVRNIQLPLEKNKNYLAYWNHYLLCKGDQITTLPSWATTAETTALSNEDRKNYMWVKSLSDMPVQPDSNGNYWRPLLQPLKPGVQVYDYAVFVVTESIKYGSSTAAGNAVSKRINTICSPSNTFGIRNFGNWKLDQASVAYDGKNWIATQTYTHSADNDGWDGNLYDD